MRVEGQVHRIDGHIGIDESFHLFVPEADHGNRRFPIKTVVDNEQVRPEVRGNAYLRAPAVDRRGDSRNLAAIFELQSVVCGREIPDG